MVGTACGPSIDHRQRFRRKTYLGRENDREFQFQAQLASDSEPLALQVHRRHRGTDEVPAVLSRCDEGKRQTLTAGAIKVLQ